MVSLDSVADLQRLGLERFHCDTLLCFTCLCLCIHMYVHMYLGFVWGTKGASLLTFLFCSTSAQLLTVNYLSGPK